MICHEPMSTWNNLRREALQHVLGNWRGSRTLVEVGVDVWNFMQVNYDDLAKAMIEIGVYRWCLPAKRCVRSTGDVVDPLVFSDFLGLGEVAEVVFIQTVVF